MPGTIFISYRRHESPKDARALYERLRREFGEHRVFIDLEGIDPGEDFVDSIERQLHGCQVLVALIGRGWAEATNERGERRLDDENDFVRIELRTALKRGIRVIPVLVDGCPPPAAGQLPEDLRSLVRRQAVALDFHRFDADVGRLVSAIRRVLEAPPPAPPAGPPPAPKPLPRSPRLPLTLSSPHLWLGIGGGLVALVALWLLAMPRREVLSPERTVEPAASAANAAAMRVSQPAAIESAASAATDAAISAASAATDAAIAAAMSASQPAAAPSLAVLKRFRDCDDPACPWLVTLDEGNFTMGSPAGEVGRDDDEGPQRTVRIGYRLAVMETEVTRGQFREFVKATGHQMGQCGAKESNWLNPGFGQTDEHPVVCVSWHDAQVYAQWLSKKTGKRYQLLSEAEWEYAARAGTVTRYSFGDDDSQLCKYGNVADRAMKAKLAVSWTTADCDDRALYTAPVRRYRPNDWGLYDMHGNVWEWVQDCGLAGGYADAPADGSSAERQNCMVRLLRGGAWNVEPRSARSAYRFNFVPANRDVHTGLRLARMLP